MFQHASDLVKFIKHKSSDTSLAVAGYPDLHPESLSLHSDLKYLNEKVEAGADFIITQTSFSSTKILQFIKACREVGIKVPIIPGIFIPPTYSGLMSMCRFCKINVPDEELRLYTLLKDDPKAFQDYAVGNTIKLIGELFQHDEHPVVGVHFYSLNNFELVEKVTKNFDFK